MPGGVGPGSLPLGRTRGPTWRMRYSPARGAQSPCARANSRLPVLGVFLAGWPFSFALAWSKQPQTQGPEVEAPLPAFKGARRSRQSGGCAHVPETAGVGAVIDSPAACRHGGHLIERRRRGEAGTSWKPFDWARGTPWTIYLQTCLSASHPMWKLRKKNHNYK